MREKKTLEKVKLLSEMNKPKKQTKWKVDRTIIYDIPPGCEFDYQRQVREGKIKKEKVMWGMK